ncbi:phosphotriesterase family protein [Ornithinimicrobium sediminis]|uniref:phosphotriesterase family protein n=1 Tax=Ornithinimicrobium sediminis TaxID=2904603 RepID=UPI001E30DB83|nr:aryldialkylphosphatase [Ornithinimicrobium sediminis]
MVRTVLGDIAPEDLGPTDYHEHLFQVSPLLAGDELDDEAASAREAALLRRSGARAMVDPTPLGLGRRPDAVARIAADVGLHVVHATGAHHHGHYAEDDLLLGRSEEDLAGLFAAELLTGMAGSAVRAGLIKTGVGYWSVSPFEHRVLAAAGALSADHGVPVMVHLEHGSAAHEVLDLLGLAGCPPERVALAHVDRNPDPGLHADLAARGSYLGYDGAARHQRWPDSVLVDCLATVVAAGHGDRLLLGGDVARRSRYVAYGGLPGLAYLFDRFVPRVRERVGEAATGRILLDNPARWLTWTPPVDPSIADSSTGADP